MDAKDGLGLFLMGAVLGGLIGALAGSHRMTTLACGDNCHRGAECGLLTCDADGAWR